MKSWLLCRGFLLLPIIAFALLGRLHAQNFTVLRAFSTNSPFSPFSPNKLVLSGNTIYGVASGGAYSKGLIFAINTDGTGFTNLHNFAGPDGASPNSVIVSGSTIYGSASTAGAFGSGTLFAMQTDGSGFTNLYHFSTLKPGMFFASNADGTSPELSALSGNVLYGAAFLGGPGDAGTVFAINTDGSGFTTLHGFAPVDQVTSSGSNPDGASPAGVFLSGDSRVSP